MMMRVLRPSSPKPTKEMVFSASVIAAVTSRFRASLGVRETVVCSLLLTQICRVLSRDPGWPA